MGAGKSVMTVCWAPEGEDWRLFRASSREIVSVEKRFEDLTAAKIFGSVSFEIIYRVLWWTLRQRGEIPKDVSLGAFMDANDITLNVPVRLLEDSDLAQLRDQGMIVEPPADRDSDELGDDSVEAPARPADGDEGEATGEPDPTGEDRSTTDTSV